MFCIIQFYSIGLKLKRSILVFFSLCCNWNKHTSIYFKMWRVCLPIFLQAFCLDVSLHLQGPAGNAQSSATRLFRKFDPHHFFDGRWSDLGVLFGPWGSMVENMRVRNFWGPPVLAHHQRPFPYPLPTYPTPHVPGPPAIPSLSGHSHIKRCTCSFHEMHHIPCRQI